MAASATLRRQDGFDVIHARLLRDFPTLVRDLGGRPLPMLEAVGLDLDHCDGEIAFTVRQWVAVLTRAATELSIPDFGLRLAERQGGAGIYGPLGSAMRAAQTFGEALDYVARHSPGHSPAVRVWKGATQSGRHVFVGHDILVASIQERCQAVEQVMLLGHLGALAITEGAVRARRVHLRHRALASAEIYRRHFGCEVKFCRNEDGIAFLARDMDRPIASGDTRRYREATARVERLCTFGKAPISAKVRGMLMQHLASGGSGNEDIARALRLHPRTLHRRLRSEGTSFQRIKDAVRRETMLYYLEETDLELARISEKLGFAEQSALSHFARSTCAARPRDVRRKAEAAQRG